ncbi:LOW QUALITY PROTEIN: protein Shroom1 [Tupaia chinensis]|uniref:LOW QUALITY PROTEIN: protein Shroom1 n=1 Tax=Tupaia chinensis TaxID=246437 RepID=UPI000703F3DB|nr:LOW QUALITY PROTEIN: protein Shroom1 [Tupaia chinensis]
MSGCAGPRSSGNVAGPPKLASLGTRLPRMEALGPGGDRASPASSAGSLDLRRLSTRADSAYSSFSAASSGPEPRTPSPGTDLLPYLDWDYVRVVWGGPAPAPPDAVHSRSPRPQPVAAARSGPRPPEIQGAPGPLSRQATPLPVPGTAGPGSLAKQQRKWCFSEPGELDRVGRGSGQIEECSGEACSSSGLARPEPPELQHPALAKFEGHQVRWLPQPQPQGTVDLSSGSSKLSDAHRPESRGRSASGEALGDTGGPMPTAQAVPHGAETPRPLFQTKLSRFLTRMEAATVCPAEVFQSGPANWGQRVSDTCIASGRLPSLPDDEVFLEEDLLVRKRPPLDSLASQGLPSRGHATDQQYGTGVGQRAGQAEISPEYLPHECPRTAGAGDCWQGVNSSVGGSRPTNCSPTGIANGDVPTIDPTGLLATDSPTAAERNPLNPLPDDALGPSDSDVPNPPHHTALSWCSGQLVSGSTWPSQRLEELVQELARLDPSLSDTLASHPSPEPSLGLLDGLIPLAEVWAAMRPACGEAGEEAAGTSEPRCGFVPGPYHFSSTQLLPASQETRPVYPATQPDQPHGQVFSAPNNSTQAKKVELAELLQKMLQDLHAEQERLRGVAQAWARRGAALEAAVGQACAPRELERFSRFMADLERVLGLLLLLGSRLARVRRALARASSDGDADERASLKQRLGLLQRQQEDAKELKEHVARRERALREVLVRALPAAELRSYRALLAGKAAVLAQQRSLDEWVRLLQNQLDAVRSHLSHRPLSPRSARYPGTCPQDKPPLPSPLR